MKKILSLGLAVTMAMAAMPAAYAADYTQGTQVEYVAADQTAYTITVPALLNPGQSGDVTLSGTWASDCTVKVTADATVELTNSINSNDKKVLNIGFAGIEKAGDNTEAKSYTEAVSVAAMPADALFGTWSGKFNYNVEFVQPPIYDITLSNSASAASIDVETQVITFSNPFWNSLKEDNVVAPSEFTVTYNGENVPVTPTGIVAFTFPYLGDGDYTINVTIYPSAEGTAMEPTTLTIAKVQ